MPKTYLVRKIQNRNTIRVPDEVPTGSRFEPRYDRETGILTYYPVKSTAPEVPPQ
jgi:hypothetical protein